MRSCLSLLILLHSFFVFGQVHPAENKSGSGKNNAVFSQMGRGINLGNCLSAPTEGDWSPEATEQYFIDVKEAGFSTVRIPVDFFGWRTSGDNSKYSKAENTVGEFNGSISDYTIDPSYLNRLATVVNWSLSQGLVTIVDVHGKNLKDEFLKTFSSKESNSNYFTHPSSAKRKADLLKFNEIWSQLAAHFKEYPQELVFEIINEPYFYLSSEEMDTLNLDVIETIRKSGGLNTTRSIIITGGSENSIHAPLQIGDAVLQSDSNLIATFHYYWPRAFTASASDAHNDFDWGTDEDKAEIDVNFTLVKNWAASVGIPVLLGEFGADNFEGFDYSKGEFGDYGGPEYDSRVAFHGFIAETALQKGFAFTAWDSGSKSNKTIHKRTDAASTINYYPNGAVDHSIWVEDVKNALLGTSPNDDDNDGVLNDNDECENTPSGVSVNSKGCEVPFFPSDQFLISITGVSCSSKNNGIILIEAKEELEYVLHLKSEKKNKTYNFTNTLEITNLEAGFYDLCIGLVSGEVYEQCYRFEITAPKALKVESKLSLDQKEVELTMKGASYYKIRHNEFEIITNNSQYRLQLMPGENRIEVATDLACQGVFKEQVNLGNGVQVFPTISRGNITIFGIENLNPSAIFLVNTLGVEQVFELTKRGVTTCELSFYGAPNGIYFLSIQGEQYKIVVVD